MFWPCVFRVARLNACSPPACSLARVVHAGNFNMLRNWGGGIFQYDALYDALFEAGSDLDDACEQCHLEYWYPGDKALRQKLPRP